VSGIIVTSVDEAVAAVERTRQMDRAYVRAAFERHFTADRMARDYVAVYETLLASRKAAPSLEQAAA
jgi:hypothetical protein